MNSNNNNSAYKHSFDKISETEKRQCVAIGTTVFINFNRLPFFDCVVATVAVVLFQIFLLPLKLLLLFTSSILSFLFHLGRLPLIIQHSTGLYILNKFFLFLFESFAHSLGIMTDESRGEKSIYKSFPQVPTF